MRPPRYLSLLAQIVVPRRNREFVLGDLDELYAKTAAERGRLKAGVRYVRSALSSALASRPAPEDGPSLVRRLGRIVADSMTDARHALRSLRRRPGFTLMVVATLALGLGSTAAVFTMVNQLVLRPLAGAENSRSAAYLRFGTPGTYAGLTLADFDELRERATLVEGMASYGLAVENVTLGDGRPIEVYMNTVYGDFFEVLGVQPSAGRLLTEGETNLDANPLVMVISESLRSRLFGSHEQVVGRTLRVNGQPVTVIGVTGGGFQGPERGMDVEAWVPHGALVPLLGFPPDRLTSPNSTMHSQVVVLPRPGVASENAEAQLAEVLARLEEADSEGDYLSEVVPRLFPGLHTPSLIREVTNRTLRLMAWAVGLILAIACANVANLLLFRSLARRGALATLRAFGASRMRIARQFLAESVLLALLGGAMGLVVAWLIMIPFRGQSLVRMPAFEGFTIGSEVLAFVGLSAVGAAILFGTVPAWLASRFDLGAALSNARARETGRLGLLRTVLSAGQIAMTLALVVGGILLVRTVNNLRNVETGVDVERVVRITVDGSTDLEPAELHILQREFLSEVASLPGVEHAALDIQGPHGPRTLGRIGLPGTTFEDEESWESLPMIWPVTPGWFELFGMKTITGRTFEDSDWSVPPTEPIILTASLARRLFARTDVVGQTVLAGARDPVERRIIGVVEDYRSLRSPSEPEDAYFVPYGDFRRSYLTLFAKTESSDDAVVTSIRNVMESFFPDAAVPDPVYLSDTVEEILQEERMLGQFLWILSAFGLLMSAVGLYGAIYFLVLNRKREFGIRLALGADKVRILRLVARSAFTITLGGAAVGLLAAYALSRVLQSRLFGVDILDAPSYLAAVSLTVTVALFACAAPARAALRSDPVATLREE